MDAVLALAAEGCATPSVSAIAKRAGVSRSSFYTQFATMEHLTGALFEQVVAQVTDSEARGSSHLSTPAAARHAVATLVEHVDARRDLYLLALPETSSGHLRLVDRVAQVLRRSRDVSAAPRQGVTPDAASIYLAGAVVTVLRAWATGQLDGTAEQITDQIMLLFPSWLTGDEQPTTAAAAAT